MFYCTVRLTTGKNWPCMSLFQIFTNKCSKGGCKQKEMMRVTCDQCHLNYCLKHRHPLDHDCKTDGKPLSKSGWVKWHDTSRWCSEYWSECHNKNYFAFCSRHAAVMRANTASSTSASGSSSSASGNPRPVSNGVSANSRAHNSRCAICI